MTTRKNGTRTREAPDEAAPPVAAIESRGSRRKRETRERLLDAAFRLMAERGMDAVAINEITEAADVGFGSFYNHFDSKDAVYREVISGAFDSFADALDELVAVIDDPAEVIAVSIRHTLLRARRDPLWAHLLLREGFSPRATSGGLAPRLLRDIEKGVARRRFKVPDPMMTFVAVGVAFSGPSRRSCRSRPASPPRSSASAATARPTSRNAPPRYSCTPWGSPSRRPRQSRAVRCRLALSADEPQGGLRCGSGHSLPSSPRSLGSRPPTSPTCSRPCVCASSATSCAWASSRPVPRSAAATLARRRVTRFC